MNPFSRRVRLGALLTAVISLALPLSSCSSGAAGDQQTKIGYSSPSGAQPFLAANQDAFAAIGQQYGWEVIGLDAQMDPSKQASDIDQLIAQGVDAIVVQPAGTVETLLPAINRAKAAGIGVLGISAVLSPDDEVAPLDANLDNGGMYLGPKALAAVVAEETGGKGNAIGVGLGMPVEFLQIMVKEYEGELAKQAPDMKWLTTVENRSDDLAAAEKVVSEAITMHNGDIQAVMAYNDSSSLGASVALQNAGITDTVIVGQNGDTDAVEAIKAGRITATYDFVPWRQSLMAAAMVKGILEKKTVPTWIEVPGEVYTKDNIDSRRDWTKAIEEIQQGNLTCETAGCPAEITDLS